MEITDARYQELMAAESKSKTLETEVANLKTEAHNKATALKDERDLRKAAEDKIKEKDTEIENLKTAHTTELEKFKDFETISDKAKKFDEAEQAKVTARTENIKALKEKLWNEVMEAEKDFIEWLSDDKLEAYLTKLVGDSQDDWDDTNIVIWTDGKSEKTKKSSKFDEASKKWDVSWMLWSIPLPAGR